MVINDMTAEDQDRLNADQLLEATSEVISKFQERFLLKQKKNSINRSPISWALVIGTLLIDPY